MTNIRVSIHEELAKKEKKFSNSSSREESLKRSGKLNYRSSWEESIQMLENSTILESGHSTKRHEKFSDSLMDIVKTEQEENDLQSFYEIDVRWRLLNGKIASPETRPMLSEECAELRVWRNVLCNIISHLIYAKAITLELVLLTFFIFLSSCNSIKSILMFRLVKFHSSELY
ncbi:hypothetical protein K1719_011621 [Acacia pycnantha]|nr:hypothetical protein K1719_011621 [Acacia pycnantha]